MSDSAESKRSRSSTEQQLDNKPESRSPESKKSKWQKCIFIMKHAQTEFIMGCHSLYYYMVLVFIQDMVKQKSCRHKYSSQYCHPINETIVDSIQGEIVDILLNLELIRTTLSLILVLILGNWSDVHGKKLPILLPLLGNSLTTILYILNYLYEDWPLHYLYYAMIPAGICGEYPVFIMGIFGWIKDNYPSEKMGIKFALVEGVEMATAAFAPVIGGQLYQHIGYSGVFTMCLIALVVGCLVTVFCIKDKVFKSTWKQKLLDFVNIANMKETLRVIFIKRPDHKRTCLILAIISILPLGIGFFGHMTIFPNYAEKKFAWDVVLVSVYNTVQGVFQALGCFVVFPVLRQRLQVSKPLMITIGCINYIALYLAIAIATSTTGMFVATILQTFGIFAIIQPRVLANIFIENHEAGKLNSVVGVIQALSKLLGSVVGLQVYDMTLTTFPGAFYILASALLIICISANGYIYYVTKKLEEKHTIEKQSNIHAHSAGIAQL